MVSNIDINISSSNRSNLIQRPEFKDQFQDPSKLDRISNMINSEIVH